MQLLGTLPLMSGLQLRSQLALYLVTNLHVLLYRLSISQLQEKQSLEAVQSKTAIARLETQAAKVYTVSCTTCQGSLHVNSICNLAPSLR